MKLSYQGIQDKQGYAAAQVALPQYDWAKMAEKTAEKPVWVHFGAGNIFRGFIAGLQQRLLNAGLAESGIVAAETFDYDIIDKIYVPHDSMTLMVSLKADGSTQKEVIASIAKGIKANCADEAQWQQLTDVFTAPSLQMASFTITEKGYALRNMKGELMPVVVSDMENGPKQAHHAMAVVAAMLYARYQAGAMPIAMVSMDNCSHNGEKLRASVMEIVAAWVKNGLVPADFEAYVNDEARVSFPWSMIDKITPRPAEIIEKQLMDAGFEDMQPVITSRNTYIAPFVNAEVPQYLVVEDRFPNGRPALDKAGDLPEPAAYRAGGVRLPAGLYLHCGGNEGRGAGQAGQDDWLQGRSARRDGSRHHQPEGIHRRSGGAASAEPLHPRYASAHRDRHVPEGRHPLRRNHQELHGVRYAQSR